MHEQKLLAMAMLVCITVALGSCRARDAEQAKKADELELTKSSASPRGGPGNPRGPTDPSR
jgi:hypothetical protein